jgi:diguanylate cyclase
MDVLLPSGIAAALMVNLMVSGYLVAIYFYHEREQAFLSWSLACGCFVAGSLLLLCRHWFEISLHMPGYTLLVFSSYLLLRGVTQSSAEKDTHCWILAYLPIFAMTALVLALTVFVGISIGAVASLMMALFFVITERMLAKQQDSFVAVVLLLRVLMVAHALVMTLQGLSYLLASSPTTAIAGVGQLALFSHLLLTVATALVLPMFHAIREKRKWIRLANTDVLTATLTRRGFFDLAAKQLTLSASQPCTLLMIDIDHFKPINDQHGHATGDLVLQQVAKRIRSGVRKSDLVGRLGGEEFGVLMPQTDKQEGNMIANRLLQQIASSKFMGEKQQIRVTVSIGAIVASRRGLEDLLREADRALYQAKSRGRNMLQFADEPI